MRCALVRSGGSIPIVAELADRGIPTIVTGFARRRGRHPRAERVLPPAQPRARRGGRARAAGRAGGAAARVRRAAALRGGPRRAGRRAVGARRHRAGQLRHALLAGLGTRAGEGRTPDLDLSLAPTPHPLATLVGVAARAAQPRRRTPQSTGRPRPAPTLVLAFLALAALGWVTYALGSRLVRHLGRRAGRGDHPHAPAGPGLRRARLRRHPLPRARARRAARRDAAAARGRAGARAARGRRADPPRGVAVLSAVYLAWLRRLAGERDRRRLARAGRARGERARCCGR